MRFYKVPFEAHLSFPLKLIWQLFLHSADVIHIKIGFSYFFLKSGPDRNIFIIFGPVRSFVGTVRKEIFHMFENLERTLYFFNFSKFWSGPRTGTKKNRPRYGFFRTKIRTTDRTRFESGPKSGPRTGPTKIRTTYQNPDRSGFSVRSGCPCML